MNRIKGLHFLFSVFLYRIIMKNINFNNYQFKEEKILKNLNILKSRQDSRLQNIKDKFPDRLDLIKETQENITALLETICFLEETRSIYYSTQLKLDDVERKFLLKCVDNEKLEIQNSTYYRY